ncbi:hypothetical protein Sango_0573100 [Sesamum angolense]|uniref:Dienelactone hydrolase domain-containing protein n=1 Tax=Sesamum angolense TaxID=2727404 RepID=A0AAE2C1L7_9LAMI|nr:hypothetical protein Sango_0573100 [Sesamum angolense]
MSGPQCAHNPPTLDPASGAGHVQQLGGLNTYVTGDQDSKLAVILLADAFGWEVPKLRNLADKVAASGFLVVVPDFYYGDQFTREKAGPGWVETHPPDRGCEDAKNIIAALKSKGVSKIGAAGFCWEKLSPTISIQVMEAIVREWILGMVAVRLAKYECIEAAVVLHPGPITVEEINEVKTPIAILGAEIDHIAPPEMIKRLGDVDSFVKIFPGVGHGWTVRYNDDDEFAVKSALESHSDMLNWLTKYVK